MKINTNFLIKLNTNNINYRIKLNFLIFCKHIIKKILVVKLKPN